MVRISRLTDYAIVLLVRMAAEPNRLHRAGELSGSTLLPLPTVSKLLRFLTRKGLLCSQRGVHGGYKLAKKPEELRLAQLIVLFEGPLGLTVCTHQRPGSQCRQQLLCPVQGHWQHINQAFVAALENITLADMVTGGAGLAASAKRSPTNEARAQC